MKSVELPPGTHVVQVSDDDTGPVCVKQIGFTESHVAELLEDEKRRRIYYQDIVYEVCNHLDCFNNRTTVCGTAEEPSNEVQLGMSGLLYAHKLQAEQIERLGRRSER